MLPSVLPRLTTDSAASVSWCLETSLLKVPSLGWDSLPGMELPPHLLCLLFCLLYFSLPVFEDNGLLFWLPDVLCQPTEVVLWSLLSVEMFFWGICEGESDLPVPFLRHLSLSPKTCFFILTKDIHGWKCQSLLNVISSFTIFKIHRILGSQWKSDDWRVTETVQRMPCATYILCI